MHASLKQLKIFLSIAQYKTITAAAEQECLSKPALSIALNELEEQLGYKLFDRVKNRLIMNEIGRRLLPIVDELLLRYDSISPALKENDLCGKLDLGASRTIGSHLMPFLIRDFQLVTQHKNQTLYIGNTDEICHRIASFQLSIGLVEGSVKDKNLVAQLWKEDDMVIICQFAHPLMKKKRLAFNCLEGCTWILREPGSGTRDFFLMQVASKLKKWDVAFEVNANETIVNFVAAGFGLACLSRTVAQRAVDNNQVSILNIPLPKREYSIVFHQDKYRTPLINQFISFCFSWDLDQVLG